MTKKTVAKAEYKRGSGVPHPVDVHVGQRIKMRRCMMGISQEKLAAEIGLTFQQIQKYERAANRVSASKLYDFAQALNVPVSYFYQGYNEMNAADTPYGFADNNQEGFDGQESELDQDQIFSKETYELLREYYSIKNPQKRKDLYNIVKTFADNMSSE